MKLVANVKRIILGFLMCLCCFALCSLEAQALTLEFDSTKKEIIVAGVPETDGTYNYSVNGYLKFGDERVESFCYGTASIGYDIPEAQAYIFTYADKEFILPGSGTYVMTAWIETRDAATWDDLGKSDWTTLEFYYQKDDESTNWGPGLPETMVEDWEIANLEGTNKNMVVSGGSESYPYTWTINGADVYSVPAEDVNIDLQILSMDARFDGNIPGDEITNIKIDIAHSGDFGFTAKLDYSLGAEHAGRYANLFYVLPTGNYEFIQSCQIDENGVATFRLNHASSYYIVIRDEAYAGETIVEPVPEPEPEISEPTVSESEQDVTMDTGTESLAPSEETEEESSDSQEGVNEGNIQSINMWIIIVIALMVLAMAAVIIVILVKRKK